MSRPSRPWLLPVACTVLGIVWVLWLAYEPEPVGERFLERVPASQSMPPSPPSGPSDMNPARSRPEARGSAIPPSGKRATAEVRPSIAPPLQLAFQTPASAIVGEAFDVRVEIYAGQPIARIGVEVAYDPALLKGRSLEEIDYALRTAEERPFRIDHVGDGHASLVMVIKGGEAPPMNVALVQFEVVSPGSTQIRIDSISVSDASGRAVSWAATGQDSQITLN